MLELVWKISYRDMKLSSSIEKNTSVVLSETWTRRACGRGHQVSRVSLSARPLSAPKPQSFNTGAPFMSREVMCMGKGRPFKCPACGSHRTVSKGVRHTKQIGIRRRRQCKDCGKRFTPQNQQFVPARIAATVDVTQLPGTYD